MNSPAPRRLCQSCGTLLSLTAPFCSGCGALEADDVNPVPPVWQFQKEAPAKRSIRLAYPAAFLVCLAALAGLFSLTAATRDVSQVPSTSWSESAAAGNSLNVSQPQPPPPATSAKKPEKQDPVSVKQSVPKPLPAVPENKPPRAKEKPSKPIPPPAPESPPDLPVVKAPAASCEEVWPVAATAIKQAVIRKQGSQATLSDNQGAVLVGQAQEIIQSEQESERLLQRRESTATVLRSFLASHPQLGLSSSDWATLLELRSRYGLRVRQEQAQLLLYQSYISAHQQEIAAWHSELQGRLGERAEQESDFVAQLKNDYGSVTAGCAKAGLVATLSKSKSLRADVAAAAKRTTQQKVHVRGLLAENRASRLLATSLTKGRYLRPSPGYGPVETIGQALTVKFGSPAAGVRCFNSTSGWEQLAEKMGVKYLSGFVDYSEDRRGIINLSPRTCQLLAGWINGEKRSLECVQKSVSAGRLLCYGDTFELVSAVGTLTHEAIHVTGVQNEAKAQCLTAKRAPETAQLLGMGSIEPYLEDYVRTLLTPDMPLEYKGGVC